MAGAVSSEAEAMQELAEMLWDRYFKVRIKDVLLRHSLEGYKAQVVTNNGDGTLTVQRPFESTTLTLKRAASLSNALPGDQVLIVALGSMSNAFILCKTDLSNL